MSETRLPIAVLGAGPVGLATAVHLMKRELPVVVFEAGQTAGANISDWTHVQMFSPWHSNIDEACVALLRGAGWQQPELYQCPTGREFLNNYLHRVAAIPRVAGCLQYQTNVVAVTRSGLGRAKSSDRATRPFEIRSVDSSGHARRTYAAAVIDATGTWGKQNPLGASGVAALGESECSRRIRYGMPDISGTERASYLGKRILVVGSGYSAIGNLVSFGELIEQDPRTMLHWALRSDNVGRVLNNAPERFSHCGRLKGRLGALIEAGKVEVLSPFELESLEEDRADSIVVHGRAGSILKSVSVDHIVSATGARPDLSMLSELWLDLNPAFDCPKRLGCLIDPSTHTCGSIKQHGATELAQPEPGFFIVGMKSYGRASTFLLLNGYEQARSVAAYVAGDLDDSTRHVPRAACGG